MIVEQCNKLSTICSCCQWIQVLVTLEKNDDFRSILMDASNNPTYVSQTQTSTIHVSAIFFVSYSDHHFIVLYIIKLSLICNYGYRSPLGKLNQFSSPSFLLVLAWLTSPLKLSPHWLLMASEDNCWLKSVILFYFTSS